MNRGVFRLVFDRWRGMLVPVAECLPLAQGKGVSGSAGAASRPGFTLSLKPLSLLTALCFAAPTWAQPTGPQVVHGTATFSTQGNTLTVTNSPNAIINWQSFSIPGGSTTHFAQQSASSAVLNRVVGPDPSLIYGTLSSNGHVFLINPAGILVGAGSRIDVNGLVASTLNLSNADFLAGRLHFDNGLLAGHVSNAGQITTPEGGQVYLVGKHVTNSGSITSPQGQVMLAAGDTVHILDSATPNVNVLVTGTDTTATNLGQVVADSGRIGVLAATVRNQGVLNASSAVAEGGKIFLRASQDAYVDGDGRIVTTGTKGGQVEVLGQRVAVTDNAQIDASGTEGGGRVLIGGDFQGRNPDVMNAEHTVFGAEARIHADATVNGDGGTVIVWADGRTQASGRITARGGEQGGNGGFVEVSGKTQLAFDGRVDTRAPNGSNGMLLLDPTNITIGDTDPGFTSFDESFISWSTIEGNLSDGGMMITTSSIYGGVGNITLASSSPIFEYSDSLTLLAENNIDFSSFSITNTGSGSFTAMAGWDGDSNSPGLDSSSSGSILGTGLLSFGGGGSITLHAAGSIGSASAPIHTQTSSLSFESGGNTYLTNNAPSKGLTAGSLNVHGTANGIAQVVNYGETTVPVETLFRGASQAILTANSPLTINGSVSSNGQVTLTAANPGNLTINGSVSGSPVFLNAPGGFVTGNIPAGAIINQSSTGDTAATQQSTTSALNDSSTAPSLDTTRPPSGTLTFLDDDPEVTLYTLMLLDESAREDNEEAHDERRSGEDPDGLNRPDHCPC